jgi:hypothetical protein
MKKPTDIRPALKAKYAKANAQLDASLTGLRAMPMDVRADVLVSLFSMITREWALMILENTSPATPKAKRYAADKVRRSQKVIDLAKARELRRP